MRKKRTVEFTESDYLKIRIAIILLSIVIGTSYMFVYEEINELRSDYREAMKIVDDYNDRKSVRASVKAEALDTPMRESGEGFEPTAPAKEIGEISAYNAEENQTDGDPTIMASGKKVYEGAIACPSRFAFGDKIEIEGLGIYICEDRMNARYRHTNNFDIFMWDHNEAINFGRKELSFNKI